MKAPRTKWAGCRLLGTGCVGGLLGHQLIIHGVDPLNGTDFSETIQDSGIVAAKTDCFPGVAFHVSRHVVTRLTASLVVEEVDGKRQTWLVRCPLTAVGRVGRQTALWSSERGEVGFLTPAALGEWCDRFPPIDRVVVASTPDVVRSHLHLLGVRAIVGVGRLCPGAVAVRLRGGACTGLGHCARVIDRLRADEHPVAVDMVCIARGRTETSVFDRHGLLARFVVLERQVVRPERTIGRQCRGNDCIQLTDDPDDGTQDYHSSNAADDPPLSIVLVAT